jgi:hypothetical protein
MERRDRHHLLNPAKEWSLRPDAKSLRGSQGLVPLIDRELHEQIHRECPAVPLLGFYALQRTLREFQPHPSTLTSVDNLMFAIELSTKHPKAHQVEIDLAMLSVQALDLQRGYLR